MEQTHEIKTIKKLLLKTSLNKVLIDAWNNLICHNDSTPTTIQYSLPRNLYFFNGPI